MRSVFVPIGGSESDEPVMETSLAIASPAGGHLEFMHVRVDAGEAARYTPHVDFARGAAMHSALVELEQDAATRSISADWHVLRPLAHPSVHFWGLHPRDPGSRRYRGLPGALGSGGTSR